MRDETPMQTLILALRDAASDERVSVQDVMDRLGDTSFAALILIPALILITPLSGIPTFPTIGAAIIVTVTVQWMIGRRHLWLPGVLMRQSMPSARLRTALDWLKRPAALVDCVTRSRLHLLTRRPFETVALLLIVATVVGWPVLELLPFVTTVGAVIVSLLAFGLMTGDGLFVLAGYAAIGGLGAAAILIV